MIRFYGVRKQYGSQLALDEVTFEVAAGEFVFLSGSSGAGKSTLLRLIYREELPTSGQILVAGRNVATMPETKIPFLRRSIGIVFQDFRLIGRKTVFENVAYLPRILGETPARQQELALEALERVGLAHRMRAFPRELSGGEQQRVAVARAVIRGPKLLLADEPTGNLDPDLSIEILRMFLEIQARGTTVFMATHDRSLIERIGGRILTLHRGRLVSDEAVVGSEPRPTATALPAPVVATSAELFDGWSEREGSGGGPVVGSVEAPVERSAEEGRGVALEVERASDRVDSPGLGPTSEPELPDTAAATSSASAVEARPSDAPGEDGDSAEEPSAARDRADVGVEGELRDGSGRGGGDKDDSRSDEEASP